MLFEVILYECLPCTVNLIYKSKSRNHVTLFCKHVRISTPDLHRSRVPLAQVAVATIMIDQGFGDYRF